MPFDFGGSNMYQNTVNASEGLKNALKSAFGWSDATAYGHMGISGMNGLSDQQELTTPADLDPDPRLGRARRPRPAGVLVGQPRPAVPGRRRGSNCSGIAQPNWEFTRITAGFTPPPLP